MAIDEKYGKVSLEHGNIGEDEPVVVLRAQNGLLLAMLGLYYDLCKERGVDDRVLYGITKAEFAVKTWQADPAHYVRRT